MNKYIRLLILFVAIASCACTADEIVCPDNQISPLKLTFVRDESTDSTKSIMVYINDTNYNHNGSLDIKDTLYNEGDVPTSIDIPLNLNSDSTSILIDFMYTKQFIDSITFDTISTIDTIIIYDTSFVFNQMILTPIDTTTKTNYEYNADTAYFDSAFFAYDTLYFFYSTNIILTNIECDFGATFNINEVLQTENYINSTQIISPLINQDSENNVEIYF